MPTQRYELVIFEKFTSKGRTKYKPHRVGAGVSASKATAGYTLFIPPGVSISGRVLMVPAKAAQEMSEIDLVKAYKSAADEYGID